MHIFKNKALEVSALSILLNLGLTSIKLFAGIAGNSHALVSDAIHSLADIMSSVIVAAGIGLSARRYEYAAAAAVAFVLLVTGTVLGCSSFFDIVSGAYKTQSLPSVFAAVVSGIPILAKEFMYRFEEKKAKKFNSPALHADALHHRADEYISIGVLVGVVGGCLGMVVIDTIAGFVVALLIIKSAVEMFSDVKATGNFD